VGDLLFSEQVFRSRIRQRKFKGVDVNGAPFKAYSTRGPYYFYPNRDVGPMRGERATPEIRQARKTAAENRHRKIGRKGKRTPYGVRYDSYAAAKAAHGVSVVELEASPGADSCPLALVYLGIIERFRRLPNRGLHAENA
jgi:hypothetical protein